MASIAFQKTVLEFRKYIDRTQRSVDYNRQKNEFKSSIAKRSKYTFQDKVKIVKSPKQKKKSHTDNLPLFGT